MYGFLDRYEILMAIRKYVYLDYVIQNINQILCRNGKGLLEIALCYISYIKFTLINIDHIIFVL